ncbi:FKBP-type peptidyl-prolyl cis-trans isomerase [Carboxylicivirga sp. A043]|uniref:FKBP-type peptidyl-prolyl cis-trans isomerase n=1 Tax=Carboxylicivirga litoralis TaxID=2816963 RepID=UPI0021CB3CBC|nr:FKBP-type peptidyl-prolyl cis-trans isomerase [Carboxylicivirga sp. A043]MCU4157406.1 FKBP-type peptidyl-prolyl cis-trans isomerase [Carboxylicivirga sp. A043]
MRKVLLFAMLLPLLAGCLNDDDYVDYAALDEEIISEYLAENNIQAERHSSGLYYTIIEQGDGAAIGDDTDTDDRVTFSFNSETINGKSFYDEDKNHTANLSTLPYAFQIGMSQINKEGEIILYSPSQLCRDAYGYIYGEENTVMVYHIKIDRDQTEIDEEIIAAYLTENSIEAQRDDSGLYYEILTEGAGDNVTSSSYLDASYKGSLLNGDVFDEGTLSGTSLSGLIEAWQVGVPLLNKGSKARFYCPSQMCYGSSARYDGNGNVTIPGNSILIFEIEVVNFY